MVIESNACKQTLDSLAGNAGNIGKHETKTSGHCKCMHNVYILLCQKENKHRDSMKSSFKGTYNRQSFQSSYVE